MNTNRLYYGDIELIKTKKHFYAGDIYIYGKLIEYFETREIDPIIKPYKRKVILIKYPKNSYVELTKIKGIKDIINIYYEIYFKKNHRKYVIKEDNAPKHITPNSLEKINYNKPNESIKKLKKIFK